MLRRILIIFFIFYTTQSLFAQHNELSENTGEAGLMLGLASFNGDIAPDVQVFYRNYGAYVKKQLNNYVGIRINVEMQKMGSHDMLSILPYANQRNADFLINTIEGSVLGEFYFLNYISGSRNKKFTPYLGFGVGYLYTLEKIRNNNTSVLIPVKKLPLTFPLNLGLKYNVFSRFNLFAEATYRYTNFDDLEFLTDQNPTTTGFQGSSTGNDQFFSGKIGVSYSFNNIFGMDQNKKVPKPSLLSRFRRK